MAMLAYRSTPLENGLSPAELLMGRKLRTTVPMTSQQLKPKLLNSSQLQRKERETRKKKKISFDKCHRARHLKLLKPGDIVWLPEMQKKARVIRQTRNRSYIIQTDDGGTYQRIRKHLNWIPKMSHLTSHCNSENILDDTDNLDFLSTEPVTVVPENSLSVHHPLP